ncbi:MAG: DNA-3-methyladenine glycosylase [Armatimonadetes bacterium]|nr:DNA-3-methyladenine glycosylase [Armatimonadota bacterium]
MPHELPFRERLASSVHEAALALMGCILVREELSAKIVEVEAYRGGDDPGCHAFRGITPRNRVMFGPAGYAYTYFTYGNHWMLNVVAGPEGEGSAVLIRAAQPLTGLELMAQRRPKCKGETDLLSGPGKLAAAFGVTGKDYGIDLLDPASLLRIVPGERPSRLLFGPRVGLSPGKGDGHLWRLADSGALKWVSRPHSGLDPLEAIAAFRATPAL